MFYRQKLLMALLETFGGHLPSKDLQKYLFLYTKLCEKEKSYDFVPYKYGCFSFQSYKDKSKLIELGHLKDEQDWEIRDARKKYSKLLKNGETKKLKLFNERYKHLKGKKLIHHIYKNYPYYAINSLIAKDILNDAELNNVRAEKINIKAPVLATIGYEGVSFEEYLNKLIRNDIKLLVDVRRNPISRKYGFSKKTLSSSLESLNIKYIHMPELGIDSTQRKSLVTMSDYKKLFKQYNKDIALNNNALTELHSLFKENKRIALTCFEYDHNMCHRGTLANFIQNKFDKITIEHF